MASVPISSGVDTQHPSYGAVAQTWAMLRDVVAGAEAVKDAGETYLPMPSGFRGQSDGGAEMYSNYRTRAEFPELLEPTILGMLGVIHRNEAQIEIPASMEYLWEDSDGRGLPLETLHRRITQEILTVARAVIVADTPPASEDGTGTGLPRLLTYTAESLINWSVDRDLFVFQEAGMELDGFRWVSVVKWRVLRLVEGRAVMETYDEEGNLETVSPLTAQGGASLEALPVVVGGARDLDVDPDNPPLRGVARAAIAVYRLDADWRHQLFMTGQETLVFTGLSADQIPSRVGAGVSIALSEPTATAKYVGPNGVGIKAHETAIALERENAAALGARVFDAGTGGKAAESGEALRIRRAATTASLVTIAANSAGALEAGLRAVAVILGEDPKKVIVKPNLKFLGTPMTPEEAIDLVKVWQAGGISYKTLYERLQSGELASEERDYKQERSLIDDENPDLSTLQLDSKTSVAAAITAAAAKSTPVAATTETKPSATAATPP